jgi:endonuclease/exonuclease/phosphatase family metal-dependent hydrolase
MGSRSGNAAPGARSVECSRAPSGSSEGVMGMHLMRRSAAVVAAGALVLAGGSPAAAAKERPSNGSAVVVEVQTYNMYFGADLTPLFSGGDVLGAATAIWNEMQASRIPERARAVAEIIAEEAPDLVGLQEVSTWRSAPASLVSQDPPAFAPAGDFVTDYDALALLQEDLAELGVPYRVVVANTNFSNDPAVPQSTVPPLPVITSTGLRLAAFTDRDVILVKKSSLSRGRIQLGETESHLFEDVLTVPVAGTPVDVPRGWSSADITVRGRTFTFFNTHFEAYSFPGDPLKDYFRNQQADELADVIDDWDHPVVLVGDVNVRPTMCADHRPGSPQEDGDQNIVAYQTLLDVGLTEVWPMVYPKDPCGSAGWTSGQDSLTGPGSTLDHRIDDVFVSKGFSALQAEVVGDEQAERSTPNGLWPSDHASTWAKIRLDSVAKAR